MCFEINDRAGVIYRCVEDSYRLGVNPLVQLPLGSEANFKGVIDSRNESNSLARRNSRAKFTHEEIPQDLKEKSDSYREN